MTTGDPQKMDLLLLAQGAWGDFFRTYLVEAFPAGVRTLYVEPPLLFPPASRLHLRRWRDHLLRPWVRRVSHHTWVTEPLKALPNLFFRPIQILNAGLLTQQLKMLSRSIGLRPEVVWLCDPYWRDVAAHFPGARVVYDCFDDYDSYPGQSPRTRLRVRSDERTLVGAADLSLVISEVLYKELSPMNPSTFLLPIGLDSQHFCRKIDQPVVEPGEFRSIPRPRVGIFSRLDEKIDLALLKSLATSRQDWHLVFLGPVSTTASAQFRQKMNDLAELPNVHALGEQPYRWLPACLQSLDIGLVPYVLSDQTRALMPSKVTNYLAAGLPVVSVDLPGSREYFPWIRLAQSPLEFLQAVDQELSQEQDSLRRQRIDFVAQRDWQILAQQVLQALSVVKGGRPQSLNIAEV